MKWTTAEELVKWIEGFQHLHSGKYICPNFFKPYHLITLGLALKKAGCTDLKVPSTLAPYATRMHLWEAIGITPPKTISKFPPDGRFLPIHAFRKNNDILTPDINNEVNQLVSQLIGVIRKNTSSEYQASLSVCLLEIVNNFYDHAHPHNSLPCLISGQSWPRGNLIQIAIADSGIGIRESLSENAALLDELKNGNACELASKYGVTSKPNKNHSGYGLTLAKDLMTQSNGSYILISGNELFSCANGVNNSTQIDCLLNGTLLVLEWAIDSQLNTTSVYQSWPLPEGFNENDFF
ncbi:MAG: hypothetical protein WAW86_09285 [Gammaproteobacteria bacterium]